MMMIQRYGFSVMHAFVAGLVFISILLPAEIARAQPTSSEFIRDLPTLQGSPNIEGTFRWQKNDRALQPYSRFLIDPIQFFIALDSPYRGVTVKELAVISSTLRNKLLQALDPEYAVVANRSLGVARMRIAITNIKLKQEKGEPLVSGPLGFLPVTFILNKVVEEVESSTELTEARAEIIIEDSISGERLVVAIDPRSSKRSADTDSWEAVTEAFDLYAKAIRAYIDEGHR